MTRLPRLLLAVAVCLPAALPAQAAAATPSYPSIAKVSPLKLGVGDVLVVRGKNFRSGKGRNTVVFKPATGRAVFIKSGTSTRTRLSVRIPAKLLASLGQKAGKPVATRFRIRVLAGRFGRQFTTLKGSPVIGPVALAPAAVPAPTGSRPATGTAAGGTPAATGTGTGAVAGTSPAPRVETAPPTPEDCDGDTVANERDGDDDNDLLGDDVEKELRTNPCRPDTDGDGMSDAWEHYSALDYNGAALPAPTKRPYPNALDAADGPIDGDGDGMTNHQEYAAWATFGRQLPLNYSGGSLATGGKRAPAAGQEWMDRDGNRFMTDNERDADGDGLPNQEEDLVDSFPIALASTPRDENGRALGIFSGTHISEGAVRAIVDEVPLYGTLEFTHKVLPLNWLDPDTDGDRIDDAGDDQDADRGSNLAELVTEITRGKSGAFEEGPINACAPDLDAPRCAVGDDDIDRDGQLNRVDSDDDGDLLTDDMDRSFGLNPFKADTDGDSVSDGYEYFSAKDLNGSGLPFPGKQPYPNGLDKDDASIDHDGDGLSLRSEYLAWRFTGSPVPLSYSDGNQNTDGTSEIDGYEDVDRDGATNYAEDSGPLSGRDFWTAWVKDNNIGCPGAENYVESPYPGPKYAGLNFVDPDSDGDGVLDGADDIDHDGLTNLEESRYVNPVTGAVSVRRLDWCEVYVSVGPGAGFNEPGDPFARADADRYARTDPFNPCKPVYSSACHKFVPLNHYVKTEEYTEDWAGAEPNR